MRAAVSVFAWGFLITTAAASLVVFVASWVALYQRWQHRRIAARDLHPTIVRRLRRSRGP